MFNVMMPKNFKKIYSEDNDLVTTFFQLYKTDSLEDEKTVGNNIHNKRDLIGGDVRLLSIWKDDFLYSYNVSPKGKVINFTIQVAGKNDALSGEILKDDKLEIRNFNPEVANGETKDYYETQVISNLKLIFKVLYHNS